MGEWLSPWLQSHNCGWDSFFTTHLSLFDSSVPDVGPSWVGNTALLFCERMTVLWSPLGDQILCFSDWFSSSQGALGVRFFLGKSTCRHLKLNWRTFSLKSFSWLALKSWMSESLKPQPSYDFTTGSPCHYITSCLVSPAFVTHYNLSFSFSFIGSWSLLLDSTAAAIRNWNLPDFNKVKGLFWVRGKSTAPVKVYRCHHN